MQSHFNIPLRMLRSSQCIQGKSRTSESTIFNSVLHPYTDTPGTFLTMNEYYVRDLAIKFLPGLPPIHIPTFQQIGLSATECITKIEISQLKHKHDPQCVL